MRNEDAARLRDALHNADLVLIGASNGLDMAEGLNVFAPDAHFAERYGDLAQATGARSIIQGIAMPWNDASVTWAWASRFADVECNDYEPTVLMEQIESLTKGADRFVITCNVDGHFVRAGFDARRVMETEGSVRELSCSRHCRDDRYPAQETTRLLNASIEDGRADLGLVPTCPHCNAPLELAMDERRLAHPDAQLDSSMAELEALVRKHHGGNVVVLELGVGRRNGAIKALLQRIARDEPNVTYAVFNYGEADVPRGLEDKTIVFEGDMAAAFGHIVDEA